MLVYVLTEQNKASKVVYVKAVITAGDVAAAWARNTTVDGLFKRWYIELEVDNITNVMSDLEDSIGKETQQLLTTFLRAYHQFDLRLKPKLPTSTQEVQEATAILEVEEENDNRS